jgi:hypothetical protein
MPIRWIFFSGSEMSNVEGTSEAVKKEGSAAVRTDVGTGVCVAGAGVGVAEGIGVGITGLGVKLLIWVGTSGLRVAAENVFTGGVTGTGTLGGCKLQPTSSRRDRRNCPRINSVFLVMMLCLSKCTIIVSRFTRGYEWIQGVFRGKNSRDSYRLRSINAGNLHIPSNCGSFRLRFLRRCPTRRCQRPSSN